MLVQTTSLPLAAAPTPAFGEKIILLLISGCPTNPTAVDDVLLMSPAVGA